MTGDLEVDEDTDLWDDHDEEIDGPIDDLKDEVPEGFKYNCCDATGDQEGCRTGPHQTEADIEVNVVDFAAPSDLPESKKRRIWE